MMKRYYLTMLLAGALLSIFAGSAPAHAMLDHSTPAVGSTADKAPADVRIVFSENIEPTFSAIEVTDSAGNAVDQKDSHGDDKNHAELIVTLKKLPPGTYTVSWHVVSADTHKTHGTFTFAVKGSS